MYGPLLACLSLATLLAVDTLASLCIAGLWPALEAAAARLRAASRARLLFLLRTAPALLALVAVLALLIPSYVIHEPRDTEEAVSAGLGLLAALSLIGIACALRRGAAAWIATRRLLRTWQKHARPVTLADSGLPAFRIRHRFPVVGIVHFSRPRLFIAEQVFLSLGREELAAVLAHERGHLAAGDSFKRALLAVCRDVLGMLPRGRHLERLWSAAAEEAADDYAARTGPTAALDLASALVKLARLAPAGSALRMPAGAHLVVGDPGSITARVVRLTRMGPGGASGSCAAAARVILGGVSVLLSCLVLAAAGPRIYAAVHAALEVLVSL